MHRFFDHHLQQFLLVASGAVGTHNRSFGFGRHIHYVNPANFAALDLHGNLATVFSVLGTVWSKTSFAITLLRLMQSWPKRVGIWFIIITTNLAVSLASPGCRAETSGTDQLRMPAVYYRHHHMVQVRSSFSRATVHQQHGLCGLRNVRWCVLGGNGLCVGLHPLATDLESPTQEEGEVGGGRCNEPWRHCWCNGHHEVPRHSNNCSGRLYLLVSRFST